jgi:hypothetical protein
MAHYSFLEWDRDGFFFAPSRSRHQRRTSCAGDFASMLSAARGVRDRRDSRFRARSAISSRRARKSKNPGIALCASLRTVVVRSSARRRASRAEKQCFARGCSRVHFCTCFSWPRVHVHVCTLLVTSTVRFFANYVEDYLRATFKLLPTVTGSSAIGVCFIERSLIRIYSASRAHFCGCLALVTYKLSTWTIYHWNFYFEYVSLLPTV